MSGFHGMMGRQYCIAWFVLAVLYASRNAPAQLEEAQHVAGKWVATGGEAEGMGLPAEAFDEPQKVTFTKEGYSVEVGGRVVERGKYLHWPKKAMGEIDLKIEEGLNAGRVQRGIYERKLGSLRVCLSPVGESKRPDAFLTTKGSGRLLLQFGKQASEEAP
jgi:uncharacterized protein (TIGR03067 family)